MAINSRNKGASGEREFSSLVSDWSGIRLIRNLEQSRSGGHDLIVHPDESGMVADVFRTLAIECKRHSKSSPALIKKWWQQARDQAEPNQLHPVLAFRANRQDWQVIVPLYLVNSEHSQCLEIDSTALLSVAGFCGIVREMTSATINLTRNGNAKSR